MNKDKVKTSHIFSEGMGIEAANGDGASEKATAESDAAADAKTKEEGTNIITRYIEVPGVEE
jgi:hypothetical protein